VQIEHPLNPVQTPEHGRMVDAEGPRRAIEGAVAGNGEEIAEVVPGFQHWLRFCKYYLHILLIVLQNDKPYRDPVAISILQRETTT
jgi:hypothetical protein